MAIPAGQIWEVESGGSDTANAGGFNPLSSGMATDGAATVATGSSPVFTSASYNFVSGDVGAWLFIKSGTNWTPGWYKIASVASNAATLSAGVGNAVLLGGTQPSGLNASAGCASTASPTGATWTVDYSQQSSPISLTSLTTAAANAIILTASATKAMVGNSIQITGGTNFITGVYSISSVSAGTSLTVDRNCTSAAGLAGTGGVGGAFASVGMAGSVAVSGNSFWTQSGSYSITSATANVSGGTLSLPAGGTGIQPVSISGYGTNRTDLGTKPVLTASGISAATLIAVTADRTNIINLSLNGANLTTIKGIADANSDCIIAYCKVANCPSGGIVCTGDNDLIIQCEATGNGTAGITAGNCSFVYGCYSHANSGPGFSSSDVFFTSCISAANTGSSSDGFATTLNILNCTNCVSWGNGRDGFRISGDSWAFLTNCISENNSGYAFNNSSTSSYFQDGFRLNCASYNNTSGVQNAGWGNVINDLILTGDAFVSASTGNFALNSTAGSGLVCQNAGYPGTFPGGLTTGYLDIGAAQSQQVLTPVGQCMFD